jgi:hypothetical protein
MITKATYSLLFLFVCHSLSAQVHYRDNGQPWTNKTNKGPDKEVPGWFYNLGITGIRAQLVADKPKTLEVKYTFKKSPAYKKILAGDLIIGAGGKAFKNPHLNGYGMDKFGAQGPIEEFALALDIAQSFKGKGSLKLDILRKDKKITVSLNVGTKYGSYSSTYPYKCQKSDKITKELLEFLIDNQQPNGSFGNQVDNLYAPLALMASGNRKYSKAIKRNVYYQAEITKDSDRMEGLINWKYMTAAIVISEYYLKNKDRKVIKELQGIYDFLCKSQYTDMTQINKKDPLGNPNRPNPKTAAKAHGGWGHNPGYEGYGPIAMITGEGALAFAMMQRCGIKVNKDLHNKAYAFLKRGTGSNGYTWYADQKAADNKYADMGRTGVSTIAHWLTSEQSYKDHALHQSKLIGNFPKSFPDTHGSPILGMGYTALGAHINQENFTKLMQANKFWFTLAQCCDGSFYYQPNRDNAGYGANSRLSASAVTAFIFLMTKRNLTLTGSATSR